MFNLIPSGWLVLLNNGDTERAHCLSLLLEGWIFSSGWNYNSLSKTETMILGLCIASNHTKVVTLFMGPLHHHRDGQKGRLPHFHKMNHLTFLLLGSTSTLSILLWVLP